MKTKKKQTKMGRPLKYKTPTVSTGIRLNPTIKNAIVRKFGSVQKWIDSLMQDLKRK